MPVTVVVGGQFGSEGKGKVAHYLAREMKASVAIRCGGPNSGHTVIDPNGNPIIFQQLPTASILPDISIVLCAGMYIDLDILSKEIKIAKLPPERLFIDPNAVIITPEIKKAERDSGLIHSIASTGSGTGEAVIRRIKRHKDILFAKDEPSLSMLIKNTKSLLREKIRKGNRVIIEGTQGYGLSLLHSQFYPHVTSRDTTAAGFLSEAGLSPLDVDDIALVLRSYPIRVGGTTSGPLPQEIEWKTITNSSGSSVPILEYTSVTKKLRRVARFDSSIVKMAISVNYPTNIFLNHIDYIDAKTKNGKMDSEKVLRFLRSLELNLDRKINFLGFGPGSIVKNDSNALTASIQKELMQNEK
jgi:adenylosuccinate synthase